MTDKPGYDCTRCQNFTFETLGDWKKHMTNEHGGYSDAELQHAAGSGEEGAYITGEDSFEQYAARMPSTESGLRDSVVDSSVKSPGNTAGESPTDGTVEESAGFFDVQPSVRRIEMSKNMKKQLKRMKQLIAEKAPRIVFQRIAEQRHQPSFALTDTEADFVSESIEVAFEAFGIQFEIMETDIVLTSKIWLLLYPVLVILSVFLLKSAGLKVPSLAEPDNSDSSSVGVGQDIHGEPVN